MPVPQLQGAVKGWTRMTTVEIQTQSVVNHKTVEIFQNVTRPMNFQPMPPAQVARKPEEQRTWTWWSVIIRDRTLLLKTDDKIVDSYGRTFRVEKANDWRTSGFTKYEAVEDYTEPST